MRGMIAANLLIAGVAAGPGLAAVGEKACPIDQVVASVQSVDGDATKAHIKLALNGDVVTATPGACILYGDRVQADPDAIVTLRTAEGNRHVGGQYDAVYQAPQAVETVSSGVASYVAALYQSLFNRGVDTVYATGRANGLASSEDPNTCALIDKSALPLAPLDRLGETRQRIGADLGRIIAAWKSSGRPRAVRATLRKGNGEAVQAAACRSGHVVLSWPPGGVRPGEILTLEIVDGRGTELTYELVIVDPKDLPSPPVATHSLWLDAAWRLVAGPPDTRLDSIARLQTAPPDNLAAQTISEAI